MIVPDASILANALADDAEDGRRARDELRGHELSAPDLADVEVTAVLRRRWLAKTLPASRFAAAVEDLNQLSMDRYPVLPFLRRAYELRANVTAYDATYVALAELLECALVTADGRLAKAPGLRCEVRLVSTGSVT